MKQFQKATAIILAFCLLLSVWTVVPVGAANTDDASVFAGSTNDSANDDYSSGTTGECTWTLYDGVLTISGNGAMGSYTWNLDAPWYPVRSDIRTVVVKSNVTSIGGYAFYNCTSLESITIGNSVTSIGERAFYKCTSLASITIPDSVTRLGYGAFHYCTNLKSVTIPDSVTTIDDLTFYACTSLSSINVDNNNGNYSSLKGVLFNKDKSKLIQYPAGKQDISYVIPDSVTWIGDYAFGDCCTNLISVTIPSNVDCFGLFAFDCNSIKDVYYGGSKEEWVYLYDYACYMGRYNDFYDANIHFNINRPANTGTLSPVSTSSSGGGGSVTVKTEDNKSLNIELEKDLKFTVPSNVPLIGGKRVKVDLSFVPVTAAITGNTIRVGFGYNRDLTKDSDEQNWCNWKNYINGYKNALAKGKKLRDVSALGVASAGMGTDFDFEFYGYFEGTIKDGQVVGSGNAKLKLEAALKNEWQTAVGIVPIVLKFQGKVGADNTSKLSFNFATKKMTFANKLDLTLPQITASAGIGIAHVADVSVYGEGKNVLSIYSHPKKVTGTLSGEIGASVKALTYSGKKAFVSGSWTYYDSSSKSSKNTSSASVGSGLYDNLDFKIDRSYLKTQSGWLSKKNKTGSDSVGIGSYDEFTYSYLQDSIFDGAAPKLIQTDSNTILIWIGDDAKRSDGNQTVVYYSVYNDYNETWSNPKAVEDNGTADFYPDIATDGKNTYIAWTDAKTVFDSNVTMEETAAACEIKLARFNPSTKTFIDAVSLTNNNTLDYKPSVAVNNGNVSVAWINNSANALLENKGTDTVYRGNDYAVSRVYTSDKKIYELANSGSALALSVDSDGDITSATDSEIYIIDSAGTLTRLTDNSSDENNLAFSEINGETIFTYQSDGVIYGSADLKSTSSLSDEGTLIMGEYSFAGNRLYSVESNGEDEAGTDLYSYSLNKDGLWSNPVRISQTGAYVRNPAFVSINGEVCCVFLKTEAKITEDNVTETTDLCTTVIPKFHDVTIDDVQYDSENVAAGKNLPVTLSITNTGTEHEDSINIVIKDQNNTTVLNEAFDIDISSGEQKELEISLPVAEKLNGKTTYNISIICSGAKDSTELDIGYTQLSLTTGVGIRDNSLGMLVNAANNSSIATEAALAVKTGDGDDAETLDVFYLGEIKGQEKLSYYIEKTTLDEYKEKADILYLTLISYKDEEALGDNDAIVNLDSFEAENDFILGDIDGDGEITVKDATEIMKHTVYLTSLTEEQLALADVNNDGDVNVKDAADIMKYTVHLIDSFG